MEEMTYSNKAETNVVINPQTEILQIGPKRNVPNYHNFYIRRDSGLRGLKGKSLLQAAMEWKIRVLFLTLLSLIARTEPANSSSENPRTPEEVEEVEQAEEDCPLNDAVEEFTDEDDVHDDPSETAGPSEPEDHAYTVDGQHGNARLYTNGNGYFYRKKTAALPQLRCTYSKCAGRASLIDKGEHMYIFPRRPHSCEPNTLFPEIWALKRKIFLRCSTDIETPFLQIFCEETSANIPEAVSKALNFESMLSSMVNWRARAKGKLGLRRKKEANPIKGPPKPAYTVDSRHQDTKLYTDGSGYFYRRKMVGSNVMRCTRRNCRGRAHLSTKDETCYLTLRKHHSCEPNTYLPEIIALKKKIFKRCSTDLTTPLTQIFKEETSSPDIPEAVINALSYRSLSCNMSKVRKRKAHLTPPEPLMQPITGDVVTPRMPSETNDIVESAEEISPDEESGNDSSD